MSNVEGLTNSITIFITALSIRRWELAEIKMIGGEDRPRKAQFEQQARRHRYDTRAANLPILCR